jgi:hypothetical protein
VLLFIGYGFLGLVIPTTSVLAMEEHGEIAGTASALMGTLHFATGAVAMAVAGLFFDGTPLPMVFGITISAVVAFALAQVTLGRRRENGRRRAGGVSFVEAGHPPGLVSHHRDAGQALSPSPHKASISFVYTRPVSRCEDTGSRTETSRRQKILKFIPSVLLLLFAATFLCIWLLDRRNRHLLLFALAFLTISAATVVQFALWPADVGYNTIACAVLYSAAPLFLVQGVLMRSGKSMARAEQALWFGGIVAILTFFYYVHNDLAVRVYALNFGMGGILLSGA